jgi:signal transduction histidine kinase
MTIAMWSVVEERRSRGEVRAPWWPRLHEANPIPLVGLDGGGVIRDANDAALAFFGRDRDGVVGRSFEVVTGYAGPPFWAARGARQIMIELDRGKVEAVVAFDRGGCVVALIQTVEQAAARERERLRDEWTAMVAHDLRQPLTLIRLCEATLSGALAPGTTAEKASQTIRNAVQRMTAIIDELLEMTTMEGLALRLARRPVDPHALLTTVTARMPAMQRVISVCAPSDLPVVQIDAARIERVLDNLLENALKYGAPGPIEVTASASASELTIEVSNIGSLGADELAQMFSRFYRTPAAVRSRAPGMGLGLAIAKAIVEAHGGRIGATSGGGRVTVSFSLPY